ncbi:hypothetical protein SSX86_006263 [Deinandra increscens subsp. villosa]|uniref:ATP-dependent DNA helicase n=1 Tax=Deinandra increscens subsp. villosa TaxID=3103831 RepID=A0AAP0DEX6_9ASTR
MKVNAFIAFLRSERPYGVVAADLYTIEFQKRGLPYCHTLLWVTQLHRIRTPQQLDEFICAEVPDESEEPVLYKMISESMIHGPCGLARTNSPYMSNGNCSKNYPRAYEPETRFDSNDKVHYRRSRGGPSVDKGGVLVDCGFVVSYNKHMCTRFQAHINDAASSSKTKVKDDEIQNFVDGHFICPHEASWPILNFPIHQRVPAVQALAVLLEGKHNVTFRDRSLLANLVSDAAGRRKALTEWLHANTVDQSGCGLKYIDYLSEYNGELFYLRLLLNHQRGCSSFADIRTVADVEYSTYRGACETLRLIGDDREWTEAFVEATKWANSTQLRHLFTHMILFCEVANPMRLLNDHWRSMSDDFNLAISKDTNVGLGSVPDIALQQSVFYELEKLLNSNSTYSSLVNAIRAGGDVVLAVAASGIAGLLLPCGRTAHSRFKIPINLKEESLCSITKNSQAAHILIHTSLIIWDEAPMSDRKCFEALDRTLRDILDEPNMPFGGKSVLLGGDFRQTLPVQKRALTENLHLHRAQMTAVEKSDARRFAEWLLTVGDGSVRRLGSLIGFIYDDDTLRFPTSENLCDKAIVCSEKVTANDINKRVLGMTPGSSRTYLSTDSLTPRANERGDIEILYPPECLNALDFQGVPAHVLEERATQLMKISEVAFGGLTLPMKALFLYGGAIEALFDASEETDLNSMVSILRCYRIEGYKWARPMAKMRVTTHSSALQVDRSTVFTPIDDNNDIPHFYYSFLEYDRLRERHNNNELMSGVLQLQSTSATRVAIDPHLELARSLAASFNPPDMADADVGAQPPKLTFIEKPSERGRRTMASLLTEDPARLAANVYTCEAYLTALEESRMWYYTACPKCNIYADGDTEDSNARKKRALEEQLEDESD